MRSSERRISYDGTREFRSRASSPAAPHQGNDAVTLSKEELEETADRFRKANFPRSSRWIP